MDDHQIVTEDYKGPDRRRETHITPEQLDRIAEKAAEKAVQKMMDNGFKAIGKTVVEKFLLIVGVMATGVWAYGLGKGWWGK